MTRNISDFPAEVLDMIFLEAYQDPEDLKYEKTDDTERYALVCRAFRFPALRARYRFISVHQPMTLYHFRAYPRIAILVKSLGLYGCGKWMERILACCPNAVALRTNSVIVKHLAS